MMRSNKHIKINPIPLHVMHELINKYFEAELSEEEEEMLRDELANCTYDDTAINEAKAVMGLFATGRNKVRASHLIFHKFGNIAAIAAMLAVVFIFSILIFNDQRDICVTYIAGNIIGDEKESTRIMESQLNDIAFASQQVDSQIDDQLSVFSSAFNDTKN